MAPSASSPPDEDDPSAGLGISVAVRSGLLDEDKKVVQRARRIQKYLAQPFFVAEQFTGMAGVFVPREDTVRSFKEILEGEHDSLPEDAFYMVSDVDAAVEKAKSM